MTRLDDFVRDVAKSGLVSAASLQAARTRLPPGPDDEASMRLARLLVDEGALTKYQAAKVLSGVTKGFFLGGYRIQRRLGQGGMGKVYLAVHETGGQKVAIKVLPPKKVLEEGQALLRFRREMDLSQRVRHPNIARTIEVGSEDGVYFMVMEYIPGDSLYHVVKADSGGPLRVPDAARYFLRVLDGLNAAHAAGLIHRDIKPSNLMVTPQGDAKILDLGLARAIGDEGSLTRENVVIGTLDYASPEQLSDAARADRRSDLYSLGCTLYFTLAGRPPFEGGDVVNKIYKQRMEDPEPLEQVARGVPAAFAAIVRKLMAKEADHRYQVGQDLQADLVPWTNPARLKAILGAEAESARAFRPPPPELDDDDLRLLPDDEGPGGSTASLRDLGDAEPGFAPRHKSPPPPRPAVLVDTESRYRDDLPALPRSGGHDDSRWLIRFIIAVCIMGAIALIIIALTMRRGSDANQDSRRHDPAPSESHASRSSRADRCGSCERELSARSTLCIESAQSPRDRRAIPRELMETQAMSALPVPRPMPAVADFRGEIVEIALLLPKNRADALISLARQTHQSVGQILRALIDRALTEAE